MCKTWSTCKALLFGTKINFARTKIITHCTSHIKGCFLSCRQFIFAYSWTLKRWFWNRERCWTCEGITILKIVESNVWRKNIGWVALLCKRLKLKIRFWYIVSFTLSVAHIFFELDSWKSWSITIISKSAYCFVLLIAFEISETINFLYLSLELRSRHMLFILVNDTFPFLIGERLIFLCRIAIFNH